MKGSTHLAAGLAVGLVVARVQGADIGEAAALAGVAALAGLAPDWLQVNLPGLNKTIKGAFGHRGLSHWGLAVIGVYLVSLGIVPGLALAAAAGWGSHLVLDGFNSPGVPLWWPLPWRLHVASIKSGGRLDGILTWVAALGSLALAAEALLARYG